MHVGSAHTCANFVLFVRTWLFWSKTWWRYTDHAHLIVFVRVSEVTMICTVGGVAFSVAFHVSMAASPNAPTLNERPSKGRSGMDLLSVVPLKAFEQPEPVIRPDTSS